jgi:hypothetical protein
LYRLLYSWGSRFLVFGSLALVLPALGLGATGADSALSAGVGPGRTISVRLADGGKIARLSAGRYTFLVRDRSRKDNFHLIGPAGLDKKTGVAFVGTRQWTVTLKKGLYRYRSDAHAATLRGSFKVG